MTCETRYNRYIYSHTLSHLPLNPLEPIHNLLQPPLQTPHLQRHGPQLIPQSQSCSSSTTLLMHRIEALQHPMDGASDLAGMAEPCFVSGSGLMAQSDEGPEVGEEEDDQCNTEEEKRGGSRELVEERWAGVGGRVGRGSGSRRGLGVGHAGVGEILLVRVDVVASGLLEVAVVGLLAFDARAFDDSCERGESAKRASRDDRELGFDEKAHP